MVSAVCLGLCGRLAREARRSRPAREQVRAVGGPGAHVLGAGPSWSFRPFETLRLFRFYTDVHFLVVRVGLCPLRRAEASGVREGVCPVPGARGYPVSPSACVFARPGPRRVPSRGNLWGPHACLCLKKPFLEATGQWGVSSAGGRPPGRQGAPRVDATPEGVSMASRHGVGGGGGPDLETVLGVSCSGSFPSASGVRVRAPDVPHG